MLFLAALPAWGQHPRLYGTPQELERVRTLRGEPQRWLRALHRDAEGYLAAPLLEHRLEGPRMLAVSREALRRVSTLAFLFRLEHDRRFLERARQELLQVAAFPDWNPSHFLDVAEMAHAVALGYDWLYSELSEAERATLRAALWDKALNVARPFYQEGREWAVVDSNWNVVCNSGLLLAALALEPEDPRAREFFGLARHSLSHGLALYAPDGGWPEGLGYWHYATRYLACAMAAWEASQGPWGEDPVGLSRTGLFRLYGTAPSGLGFNFADAEEKPSRAAELFWLARRFGQGELAWLERSTVGDYPQALDLLWFDPSGEAPRLPLQATFGGDVQAFMVRTAWNDPRAAWLAFKGGSNRVHHAHLDLGTFVYEAKGERWFEELGPDNYNLPGYFEGARRWQYYRTGTAGQNTLSFDGNQNPRARADLAGSGPGFAVVDLSQAYGRPVRRLAALGTQGQALLQDEFEGEAVWTGHTHAAVELHGASATLRLNGQELSVTILSPPGAVWHYDTRPEPHLWVRASGPRLAVALGEPPPVLRPIADWLSPR